MDIQCLHETFEVASVWNARTLSKYFRRFLVDSETVCLSRSHKNPTYGTVDVKTWPFSVIGCHGTPSGDVNARIDSMSME